MHTLLRARQLLRVIGSQSTSTFANQVVAFVVPWLILTRTGSALSAGGVVFAMGATAIIGSIFGGLIVDRIGGRRASMISDGLSLLTAVTLGMVLLTDYFSVWLVVASQMLGILFDAPGMIAKDVMVPRAAREDDVALIRAGSLQESLQNAAMLAGPLSAGLFVAWLNEANTLLLAGALFALSIFLAAGVKHPAPHNDHPLTMTKALADLREGVVFLAKEPLLGPISILGVLLMCFIAPLSTVIFPAWFVLSGQTANQLGFFLGAQALGTIVGGLGFAAISTRVSSRKWFISTNIGYAVGLAAILFTSPGSIAAVILALLAGAASAGWFPVINTAFYSRAPETILGRVNGAAFTLYWIFVAPASLLLGFLVNTTSPETGILVSSIGLGLLGIGAFFMPSMKLLDEGEKAKVKIANA
ncbi:MAG: MFS transporter [Nitrososphaera sp.]|nr:MFS transporter [Nitrososphaera sp.]